MAPRSRLNEPDFRCSLAHAAEPMAGTAPTEARWLLIEYAGSWPHDAVAEADLPGQLKERLAALKDVRVSLVRRHGRDRGRTGVRVFTADLAAQRLETGHFADHEALLDLDLEAARFGSIPGLTEHVGLLWLVCTNGRRDRCCAEIGRPVAAALSAQWPAETWEITHLGGHRFAPTFTALPSGITIGRCPPASAVEVAEQIARGEMPIELCRGRAGFPPAAQVGEVELRTRGAVDVHWRPPVTLRQDRQVVRFEADGADVEVVVGEVVLSPRQLSCAGEKLKPVTKHEVVEVSGLRP